MQAQVINLLESLKHQLGLTMVIVAHGLAVIRHMSDRVAVMYLGQIVELASVDEIFDAPLHPYTQALIASAPQMQPGARRAAPLLQGDLPNPADPRPGADSIPVVRMPRMNVALPSPLTRCWKADARLPATAGRRLTAIAVLSR